MKFLLLNSALLLLLVSCSESIDQANDNQSHILTVNVKPLVISNSYNLEGSFIGRVEASRASQLGFDIGGKLVAIMVDESDKIQSGQPLAQLSIERYQAAENQVKAQLSQARAQLTLAAATLNRNQKAFEFEGISNQQLEESQQLFDSAKAAVASSKAQLQRIQVDIKQSTLRAPYDAIVVKRRADEGEIVSPARSVLDIEEIGNRKVRIGVSADIVDKLNIGRSYQLTIEGKTVVASLKSIVPKRDVITKTIDLIFTIDTAVGEANRLIDSGTIAQFNYTKTIDQQGFWVPIGVLAEANRGLWTILIASINDQSETYQLQQHAISIIHQQGEQVYIKGALKQGDLFVADGIHRVVSGQNVFVQRQ